MYSYIKVGEAFSSYSDTKNTVLLGIAPYGYTNRTEKLNANNTHFIFISKSKGETNLEDVVKFSMNFVMEIKKE